MYDVDDDVFAMDRSNPAWEEYAPVARRRRMAANMFVADVVTCATPVLAERVAQFTTAPPVVIRNGLPAGITRWPRLARDRLVVGWAGSSSTVGGLALVADALTRLARCRDVEVHTVGAPEHMVREHLGSDQVRVTPWVKGTMPYLRGIDFDVWLAPYEDTAFNRAKVGTKALEAAFLGIPVIATALPGYRDLVDHGRTGWLIDDPRDWTSTVLGAVRDRDRLTAMGDTARRDVAPRHTVEVIADEWEAVLCPTNA